MDRHEARMIFLTLVLLTGFCAGGAAVREALTVGTPVNSLFILRYVFYMGFAIFWEALVLAVIRLITELHAEVERLQRRPYRGKLRIVRTRG